MTEIVIIGGGYAGMFSAVRLAGKTRRKNVKITLINASDTFVERIRLHQKAANQTLKHHSIPGLLRGTGTTFVKGWVSSIDLKQRQVEVKTSEGKQQVGYDYLVYALGSMTDVDSVPGVRDYAYTLDSQSAAGLRDVLPAIAARGGRLLIVGGGLTGIEAATEFAESYPGLNVQMIAAESFGARLSQKGQAYLRQVFTGLGITIHDNTAVAHLEADTAILQNGDTIPFDVCVWAGSFAVPALAREAGLKVNSGGQVIVDPFLRSISHPEVYGAGDSASVFESTGLPIRKACATAVPMGAQVADNITAAVQGKPQVEFGFRNFAQCISLGRRNGLLQMVNADDIPKERILTGKPVVWLKEMICRFTVAGIKFERRFPGAVTWPGRGRAAQAEKKVTTENEESYGMV